MLREGDQVTVSSPERRMNTAKWRLRVVKMEAKPASKPRVKRPTLLDVARHCSRGPSTVRYLTSGTGGGPLPKAFKMGALEEIKQHSRGYSAPIGHWRYQTGIRERIALKDDAEITNLPPLKDQEMLQLTVLRPKRERFIRKNYEQQLRQRTLNKVLTGFLQDEITAREENAIAVQVAVERAQKEINTTSKTMAQFLSEEQKTYADLSSELNRVVQQRKKQDAELANEKKNMSDVKLKIFHQSEQLEKIRKCRDFVLEIAPDEWKEEYANETIKRQEEVKEVSENMREALKTYKDCCGGEDPGLENVLEDFIGEFATAGPPTLPFDDPKRVLGLFKDLELKSLRVLNHNAKLKNLIQEAKSVSSSCDAYLQNEKGAIDDLLEEFKEKIDLEGRSIEENNTFLHNMREGPLKKMVASKELLEEYTVVKNVYEEVIDQPKKGLNTLEMLEEIGELYFDLNRRLETVSIAERNRLEKKAKETLKEGMHEAEKAGRRKVQIQNMVKGIHKAAEKPWEPAGRPLLFRSPPRKAKTGVKTVKFEEGVRFLGIPEDDVKTDFPLVWSSNHPSSGPYERIKGTDDPLKDYEKYYPDLTIEDTEEEGELFSETEEEQEGKKGKQDKEEEKKKVKRKKRVKKFDSSDDSN